MLKGGNNVTIRRQWQSFDFMMLFLVCGFALFGTFIITSAGRHVGLEGSGAQQRLYLSVGFPLLAAAVLVDYHFIARFYIPIYAVMIGLLVFCLFLPTDETNTNRWIHIGTITVQPSEFAKIMFIVSFAKFLDIFQGKINKIWCLALAMAAIALPVILIKTQPSLSASLVVVAIGLTMLFCAKIKFRYILAAALVLGIAGAVLVWDWQSNDRAILRSIINPYQMERVETFVNPDEGEQYQVERSLIAVGSGQLNGKGYMNGSKVINGVNDFIFAVFGEEFGFAGCAAVLGVMFAIICKCLLIAARAPDLMGSLIASGVAGMLAFQVFVNVGVVTAIIPNTGMPFPFLSSGGSALLVNMAAIGLVLNVGLYKTKSIFEG
jgi:rod shape determining protein RodA